MVKFRRKQTREPQARRRGPPVGRRRRTAERLVEQGARARRVVWDGRHQPRRDPVPRPDRPVGRDPAPAKPALEQRIPIEREAQRPPDSRIAKPRAIRIEHHRVDIRAQVRVHAHRGLILDELHGVGRDLGDEVHAPPQHLGPGRPQRVVGPQDEPVDRRRTEIVVRVGLHHDLVLVAREYRERPRADVLSVRAGPGDREIQIVQKIGTPAPQPHDDHVIALGRDIHDVGHRHKSVGRVGVGPGCVEDALEIVSGQRGAVLEDRVGTKGETPGQPVGRHVPPFEQFRRDAAVGTVARQPLVAEESREDRRTVRRVDLAALGNADRERDGRRCRAGRSRSGARKGKQPPAKRQRRHSARDPTGNPDAERMNARKAAVCPIPGCVRGVYLPPSGGSAIIHGQ